MRGNSVSTRERDDYPYRVAVTPYAGIAFWQVMASCAMAALCALATALASHAATIQTEHHVDAAIYAARMLALDHELERTSPAAESRGELEREASLEIGLAHELLDSDGERPLHQGDNAFFTHDGAFGDSAAVYVPPPAADGRYALVVLLHGRNETETDVIARSVFRRLADQTHAILYAPFAGGSDTWDRAVQARIADQMDDLGRAFTIDRSFIAGISMGGAGAFHFAASHSERILAVLSIIGYLNFDDAPALAMRLRNKPVYLVQGAADPIMAPHANADTIRELDSIGVPLALYIAPAGTHTIDSVGKQIERAWSDMFAGFVTRR